jgi:hypothetical protein
MVSLLISFLRALAQAAHIFRAKRSASCVLIFGEPVSLESVYDRSADEIEIHTKLWCQNGLSCDEVLTKQNRDKEKR